MFTSALWPYMVKSLGRGTYGLGLALEGPGLGLGLGLEGPGLGLGLEILALTTSLGRMRINITYSLLNIYSVAVLASKTGAQGRRNVLKPIESS